MRKIQKYQSGPAGGGGITTGSTIAGAVGGAATGTTTSGGGAATAAAPKAGNPIASAIGGVGDAISSMLPERDEYKGLYGDVTQKMDSAYDATADALMNIPGWGMIAGAAMKAGAALSKGVGKLGGGTDGMTKKDAIMGSSFMALTPWGLINGFKGKNANTMSRDTLTWAAAGDSYLSSADLMDWAMQHQGKKYGYFSRGELARDNDRIAAAGRMLNQLKDITGDYAKLQEVMANQLDMQGVQYQQSMSGGFDQSSLRAARRGGILMTTNAIRRAHAVAFKSGGLFEDKEQEYILEEYEIEIPEFEIDLSCLNDIDFFKDGGQMSVIPEGALHARKHAIESAKEDLKGTITKKGIPVIDSNGYLQAEVEKEEIIFTLEITNKIEDLRKKYKEDEDDDYAIEAGKILAEEIMTNTDDRAGLIDTIKSAKNGGILN